MMAATDQPDHPLVRAAKRRPELIEELDWVAAMAGDAIHAGDSSLELEAISPVIDSVYRSVCHPRRNRGWHDTTGRGLVTRWRSTRTSTGRLPQQNQKPAPSTEGAAGKSPASGPVTAADITTPGTAIEAISKVHSQALETATEGDIEAATKAAPPGTDGLDIVKAARELWEANELCRARSERMSRLEEGERAFEDSQHLVDAGAGAACR